MPRIPEEVINEIRAKADIVDVISRYITLTKRGKNYWGLSPFRDDRNPSLSVSPDKQIYMDFATHEGGNVFTFIQAIEKLSYVEAVLKVASFVGIDMSTYEQTYQNPIETKYQVLYEVLDEAQKFTEYQMYTKDGLDALKKMEDRGYDHELLKRFGVGVVFGNNQLSTYLQAKGHAMESLIQADLVRVSGDAYRDVFYQRIMFPIHDSYGRVVAFSARSLENDNPVKYINTSETPLYVKGNLVYNLSQAKDAARKQDMLIITEGVTDSIAFTKAGYDNTVSLLGVACTDAQLRLLKQCSTNIVLAFDGDRAGQEATFSVGQKLVAAHCHVTVWYNDSGLDPDDAVRTLGIEPVRKGIAERLHWLEFLMSYAIGNYGLDSFDDRKRVTEFMLKHLSQSDELEQDYYLKRLADRTHFDIDVLRQQLNHSAQKQTQRPPVQKTRQAFNFKINTPERHILLQMLISKEAAYMYRDQLGFLVSDVASDLALIILDRYRYSDTLEIADIFSLDISAAIRELLLELTHGVEDVTFNRILVEENIQLVKDQLVKLSYGPLQNRINQSPTLDEQTKLFKEALETWKLQRNKNK